MKTYIKINLNKAESSEVLKERVLERTRWVVFGISKLFVLVFIFVQCTQERKKTGEIAP